MSDCKRGSVAYNVVSKYHKPVFASSVTSGRAERLRSVNHSEAISRSTHSASSNAGSVNSAGCARSRKISPKRRNLVSSVRRLDSVGCAVNTSSMFKRSTSACIAAAPTPRCFNSITAASMDSRMGGSAVASKPRAARRRRNSVMRKFSSARFTSSKYKVNAIA